MVEYESGTAINTHPSVVAGAAAAFLKAGAREVVVGEGPGHRRDVEYLLAGTGLDDVLTEHRLRFVDLNHDDVVRVPLRSRFTGLDALWLPVELVRSDFIVSMPKLKTHHWVAMTASLKNFFGVVPGAVYGWPKNILHFHGIEQSILDIVATVRPSFTIVDAIVAMEGDGPIMGQPRQMGFWRWGRTSSRWTRPAPASSASIPRRCRICRSAPSIWETLRNDASSSAARTTSAIGRSSTCSSRSRARRLA